MKVKELIKELKKLPQDLKVGVSMHDNADGEISGWIHSVHIVTEKIPINQDEYKDGDEVADLHC